MASKSTERAWATFGELTCLSPGQLSSRESEDVNRAGARTDSAQPVPHRFGSELARAHRRRQWRPAEREVGRQRRRVRASRAVRGAIRMALAGDLDDLL